MASPRIALLAVAALLAAVSCEANKQQLVPRSWIGAKADGKYVFFSTDGEEEGSGAFQAAQIDDDDVDGEGGECSDDCMRRRLSRMQIYGVLADLPHSHPHQAGEGRDHDHIHVHTKAHAVDVPFESHQHPHIKEDEGAGLVEDDESAAPPWPSTPHSGSSDDDWPSADAETPSPPSAFLPECGDKVCASACVREGHSIEHATSARHRHRPALTHSFVFPPPFLLQSIQRRATACSTSCGGTARTSGCSSTATATARAAGASPHTSK